MAAYGVQCVLYAIDNISLHKAGNEFHSGDFNDVHQARNLKSGFFTGDVYKRPFCSKSNISSSNNIEPK